MIHFEVIPTLVSIGKNDSVHQESSIEDPEIL